MTAFRHCPECGEGIDYFRGMPMGQVKDRRVHKWNIDVKQCPNDDCDGVTVKCGYIARVMYSLFNKDKKEKLQTAKEIYSDGRQKYIPITEWD